MFKTGQRNECGHHIWTRNGSTSVFSKRSGMKNYIVSRLKSKWTKTSLTVGKKCKQNKCTCTVVWVGTIRSPDRQNNQIDVLCDQWRMTKDVSLTNWRMTKGVSISICHASFMHIHTSQSGWNGPTGMRWCAFIWFEAVHHVFWTCQFLYLYHWIFGCGFVFKFCKFEHDKLWNATCEKKNAIWSVFIQRSGEVMFSKGGNEKITTTVPKQQ